MRAPPATISTMGDIRRSSAVSVRAPRGVWRDAAFKTEGGDLWATPAVDRAGIHVPDGKGACWLA